MEKSIMPFNETDSNTFMTAHPAGGVLIYYFHRIFQILVGH